MTNPNPDPVVWPKCSVCEVAYVLRRAVTLDGWMWVWQRDCKHKAADAVVEHAS